MADPARVPEIASNRGMVTPRMAAEFWAAVEECLVQFHNLQRCDAASRVTSLWKRLADIPSPPSDAAENEIEKLDERSFDEMIYHAEPWYIACNLANEEIPLDPHRTAYEQILKQNQLD